MTKVVVGSIPEKITYVYANPIEVHVGCKWDIADYDETKYAKEEVLPTFPVDADNKKTLETAKKWANSYYIYGQNVKNTINMVTVENKPLKNVRILSLEERSQGGRAYKSLIELDNNKYYVDIREDVLMDVLLQTGVHNGGVLQGEFIWVKAGTQMKLVRIDSELHKMIVGYDSTKDAKKVSKKDLEVGGIYQNRKKEKAIFLGYVDTTEFERKEEKNNLHSSGYPRSTYTGGPSTKVISFEFEKTQKYGLMLFYCFPTYGSYDDHMENFKNGKFDNYYFDLKKSHSYIEKVDQDLNPPSLDKVKESFSLSIKTSMINDFKTNQQNKNTNYLSVNIETNLTNNIAYHSKFLNMRNSKEPENDFDGREMFNKLKLWI